MNEKSLPMAGYHAVQEELANMVQEIQTEGWLIRVGDVFSNGNEPYHLKVLKIEVNEDEVEDTWIHCLAFDPNDDEKLGEEKHRAWYLNQYWYK